MRVNETGDEKKATQCVGEILLELSGDAFSVALRSVVLLEAHSEQNQ